MVSGTDRISKAVWLAAPRDRVWRAVSDAREFGSWFGVEFDGAFAPGAPATGRVAPTRVDPAMAKMQEPYAGMAFALTVEQLDPPRLFSFRWHPAAAGSRDVRTLVAFVLEDVSNGTLLTITESGFEGISPDRRGRALDANEQGWHAQTKLLEKYLAGR